MKWLPEALNTDWVLNNSRCVSIHLKNIGNRFTNKMIETPIYGNILFDIDIATINFQGKIPRTPKK